MLPGLRVGNEILSINGEAVSDLDLRQMELLFLERSVMLTLRLNHCGTQQPLCVSWSDGDISREPKNLLPPPNQSQLLEEFLDNFKKNTANGKRLTIITLLSPHFQYRWFLKLNYVLNSVIASVRNPSTNYSSAVYAPCLSVILLFHRKQKWNRIWSLLQGNNILLIWLAALSSMIKCSLNRSVSSGYLHYICFPGIGGWNDVMDFRGRSIVLCLPCFIYGEVPRMWRVP